MQGTIDLGQLLSSLEPSLSTTDYVFCIIRTDQENSYELLSPLATFREDEGLTLVVEKQTAVDNDLPFDGVFRKITLSVHSSLEAVGLTAAVATKLTEHNISANVIAAYYHDHIFVPLAQCEQALKALQELVPEN